MSLDINDLSQSDTAKIELTHPVTGAPTGWHVTIYGPASEEHADAVERLRRRRLQLIRRYKTEDQIPNDANFASFCEFLADVTASIDGLTRGGQPVEFSRKVALEIYSDKRRHGPAFAAQVANAIGDAGTFTNG